ncbi:MAG: gliding motility-associated ABC transporter ATP-binding subunit GldA [Cytophagales bacterium]|nr:MAG: gliding motility-associated ABC transporter ATP-binding subunit GldA [Cytophagales bacterium]
MSLIVKDLTKQYGEQLAVNHISFEAKKGQIVGFLGPNGAGKSTTMKIATCYLTPTSGTVEVCGYDVLASPLEVRKNVGYLPEHNPLYLDMYVHEYLHFIGSLHLLKGTQNEKRVKEVVELCGLEREQRKKIGALSKGYRQRVGLAQALIHEPPVLILDEPTSALDPNQIVEVRNVIKQISRERTVLFSSHILQEVKALCDRVVIINLGKIVKDSPLDELQGNEKEIKIMIEFAEKIETDMLKSLPSVIHIHQISDSKIIVSSSQDIRSEISKLALEKGWLIVGMSKEEISLENIFQDVTQSE